MKLLSFHYKQLEEEVKTAIDENPTLVKRLEKKEISSMYFRWELWHYNNRKNGYDLSNEIYKYCNDDNIDSALKKITGTK